MNGVWKVKTNLNYMKFTTECAAFLADTSMALDKKELSKVELKAKYDYYNQGGDYKGTAVTTQNNEDAYMDLFAVMTGATVIAGYAGSNGTAQEDLDSRNWTEKFTCKLGDDTFQVVFHVDRVTIENYSNNDTKTALETYFATRTNLRQT